MSGFFFLVSALGHTLSISRRLRKHHSPISPALKQDARKRACRRGLTLMAFGYFTQLVVFRLFEDRVLEHYNRHPDGDLAWATSSPFVRNFIIEQIGFVTLLSSFLAIEIVARQAQEPPRCPQQSVTRGLALLIAGVLVVNPLLRLGLDAATCCIVESCSSYPDPTDGYGLSSPAEIAMPPLGQCVDNWRPCAALTNATLVGRAARPLPQVNTSSLEQQADACKAAHKALGGKDPTLALHGIALGRVGRRWCTQNATLGPGPGNWSLTAQVCRLKPSWGRGVDFGREELSAIGPGGALLVALLQPFFGRFGLFAYAAPSLVGVGIALYIERPSRRARESVMPWHCVRRSLLVCLAAFLLGFLLFALLLVAGADDAALQAGSHVRLFCGAGEAAMLLLLLPLVDFHADRERRVRRCRDRCRCLRRFGLLTLSLWTLQWLDLVAVIAFDELGGRRSPWRSRANGKRTYGANILVVVVVVLPLWYGLTRLWERARFVGSCEWCIARACGRRSGKRRRSPGEEMCAVLYTAEPLAVPARHGTYRAGGASEDVAEGDGDRVRQHATLGQLCCCCCCVWKDEWSPAGEEGSGPPMRRGGGGGSSSSSSRVQTMPMPMH